jgi:hypothetical protein
MAGPWGCAGPGRVAQDKVGTLDGGPRTPSWQSPRVCRATFSNRLELGRSKEKPRVRGGARLGRVLINWGTPFDVRYAPDSGAKADIAGLTRWA